MTDKIKYCWDTSVFVGWLKREETAPLADIDAILGDIHANKAVLIVSVVTYTEILRVKHTPKQLRTFDDFLKRSNVLRADNTFPIAQKAEQIRSRAMEGPKSQQRVIKTVDATILATGIIHQADVLHSLEPKHHNLSRSKIVDGLLITAPQELSGQRALGFDLNVAPEKE